MVMNFQFHRSEEFLNQLMNNTFSGDSHTDITKTYCVSYGNYQLHLTNAVYKICMNHVGALAMNPERVQNDSYIQFMGLYDAFTF
jgi:hypothetical protein